MASDTLSWTHYFGSDQNAGNSFEGVLSTTVTHDGATDAQVTDRFNSGNGEKMEGSGNWLDTHGDELVLHLASNDASGVGQAGDSTTLFGASGSPAHDDLLEDAGYTTVSIDTSTKAVPQRIAFSLSNPGSNFPYVVLALAADETAEALARNDSGTQFGPAGGNTTMAAGYHTIGMGFDGTNLFVTVNGSKEATEVALSGNFDELTETTIGAARLSVASHFLGVDGDIEVGRVLVWDHDLSNKDRVNAHNNLRDTYSSLVEAS